MIDDPDLQKLIAFVDPVFLQRRTVPPVLDFYCSLHYGNQLTLGEWGCSLAHLAAQKFAAELGVEWALILEDDAELAPDFKESLINLLTSLSGSDHTYDAVQCFGPMGTSEIAVEVSKKIIVNPVPFYETKGAVGYVLHRSTLSLCQKNTYKGFPIGKADFPAWSHLVTWGKLQNPLITHQDGAASLVGDRVKASVPRGLSFKVGHALLRAALSVTPLFRIPRRIHWELGHLVGRRK
jgi:hypothetical protein